MIRLRQRPRIFPALLRQNERGVGLIIAEARIGRGRNRAGCGQAGGSERVGQLLREKRLESFHALAYFWAAVAEDRQDLVGRAGGWPGFRERSRSFRNFAIEARVRRWV